MQIHGDYNSASVRNFVIQFEKCEPGKGVECKSDQEILRWLQRKFILTYANQRRFILEKFDQFKIVEESRTTWIPINTQVREEIVFELQIKELELQDVVWQWGTYTMEQINNIFKLVQTTKRPYEFDNNVQI